MILPVLLLAANALCVDAPAKGYVVRVDSQTVWLDLTAADGAAPGRPFDVYVDGAELKHPVTGAVLGRVETTIGSGRIAEVAAQYSTGLLNGPSAKVQVGQRARFTASAPETIPTLPAADAPSAAPSDDAPRKPNSRGASLPYAVAGMAVADFDGIHKPQVVLASENRVYLYSYPAADGKPLAEFEISGTGVRVVGLEALDLDGSGRPALFVSVYDGAFRRFETRVLKLESGKWLKTAELPFLTRAYREGPGPRALAGQEVYDDASFPLGRIYPVVFKDGRYALGSPALPLKRADWLFGFAQARLGDRDATLFVGPTHVLRVEFDKGQWRTPDDDFGQTPLRVRWGDGSTDRLLEFAPPIVPSYDAAGAATIYAVRNMAALGGLASPFGLFNRGELDALRWDGLALTRGWRAEISGCAQGVALAEPAPGERKVLVAVRGSADQSSVWVFDP
jgi:hypothetical protein